MHRLIRESFGFRVTLSGDISAIEMVHVKTELVAMLQTMNPPFGSLADIRSVIPFTPEVKTLIAECEQMTKEAGLQRRAVIFSSPILRDQAAQLSFQSTTDNIQRQINANLTDDWEEHALAWIIDGVEPPLEFSTGSDVKQRS